MGARGSKFKQLPSYEMPLGSSSVVGRRMRRETFEFDGHYGRVIKLSNFLDHNECRHYRDAIKRIGFTPLVAEYPDDYRNCQRTLVMDDTLASNCWRRLICVLRASDFEGARPFGVLDYDLESSLTDSTDNHEYEDERLGAVLQQPWRPIGVNECFRFSRYHEGEYFDKHRDGHFVRTPDEISIYSLVVYLNEMPSGGETVFYFTPHDDNDNDGHSSSASSSSSAASEEEDPHAKLEAEAAASKRLAFHPEAGMALLFPQDMLHEGAKVRRRDLNKNENERGDTIVSADRLASIDDLIGLDWIGLMIGLLIGLDGTGYCRHQVSLSYRHHVPSNSLVYGIAMGTLDQEQSSVPTSSCSARRIYSTRADGRHS